MDVNAPEKISHADNPDVETRLPTKEQELELALQIAGLGNFRVDLATNRGSYSPVIRTWFGLEDTEMPMYEIFSRIAEEDRQRVIQSIEATLVNQQQSRHDLTYAVSCPIDGKKRYLRSFGRTLFDNHNKPSQIIGIIQDVTDLVMSRQMAEMAEEKARLAIDSAELGTYEINLATNEMITSPRFQHIWGVHHTTQRSDFAAVIHPDDQPLRKKAHEEALQDGTLRYEARIKTAPGQYRWVKVSGTFLYNGNGQPERLLGVIQDISEQKTFEEELAKQVKERTIELENKNKELERSNVHLEEFAHAASHDLKEPIRKIHFFTERLKHQLAERLKDDERFTLGRIENSSQRMEILVDDLLMYSHVSQRPHEMEDIDLNVKLERVLEDLDLDIQQKGAVLNIGRLPVVKGYRRQLQQLFQNLISNALKYSKAGLPPEIDITSRELIAKEAGNDLDEFDPEKIFYQITVKDNGIGFEQSQSERIFQMFQRLHGKKEYPGTGVGLAIARKVIQNHNGKLLAESQPGEGARFKVYLPK